MTMMDSVAAPVRISHRIVALDVLRGFALLGILVINIQVFAMVEAAYLNLTAYGDLTGINLWLWAGSHLMADQKFVSIFSMMFGAGILLMTENLQSKGKSAAAYHYRRTILLILFGWLHAHFLWYGDILFAYGVCGLIVYLLRNLTPTRLMVIGLFTMAVSTLIYLLIQFSLPHMPPQAIDSIMASWLPSQELIQQEVASYQGGWVEQMAHRYPAATLFETQIFLVWAAWRTGGLMLVGMAFYKWGILSAKRSTRFYQRLAVSGLLIGIPIVGLGLYQNFAHDWSLQYSFFLGSQYNYWGSLFIAWAYIGSIMWFCKSDGFTRLKNALAAVGRTAFSNYILQTVLCTFIFYGHGFGLFGTLPRWQQYAIVVLVWLFQLWVSPLWLRYFKFGPLEWMWRSLAYVRVQPMRISG